MNELTNIQLQYLIETAEYLIDSDWGQHDYKASRIVYSLIDKLRAMEEKFLQFPDS